MMLATRAHDLVWVRNPHAVRWRLPLCAGGCGVEEEPFSGQHDLPPWLHAWRHAPTPVVVRRECVGEPGMLAVGIRGALRHQRRAAYLPIKEIARVARPEALAQGLDEYRNCHGVAQKLLAALQTIAPALNTFGLDWGPTGGLGFFLATGLPVLHQGSDIDLVLRAGCPLNTEQTLALKAILHRARWPIDMQIDTGHGGFSFAEWAGQGQSHTARRILLKTDAGPLLVHDPWAAPRHEATRNAYTAVIHCHCRRPIASPIAHLV